jgi:hypothetical protein
VAQAKSLARAGHVRRQWQSRPARHLARYDLPPAQIARFAAGFIAEVSIAG